MSTKTIRDVNEKTWRKLRMLSAEHNMRMGRLLEKMTEDYEKRGKEFWRAILESGKMLTDKEAEELKALSMSLRKEPGFR